MKQISDYIQIFTTVEKRDDAEKIAKIVIEKRLAGCVQILGPIKSTYWWKGNIESAEECLCIMKSKKNLYKEIEMTIKENHPYETPEIVAVPIIAGYEGYLKWLDSEVKQLNDYNG